MNYKLCYVGFASFILAFSLMSLGCASTFVNYLYRDESLPVANQGKLLVGGDITIVDIDGKRVTIYGGSLRDTWIILSPGSHTLTMDYNGSNYTGTGLKETFEVEPNHYYYLRIYEAASSPVAIQDVTSAGSFQKNRKKLDAQIAKDAPVVVKKIVVPELSNTPTSF